MALRTRPEVRLAGGRT